MRWFLAVALVVPLAGCFTCSPTLDVRHCREADPRCTPGDADVVAWNPDLAGLFPDVHRFVTSLAVGEHGHATWSTMQADEFWRFHHVDPSSTNKEVWLSHAGALFRVRVLDC